MSLSAFLQGMKSENKGEEGMNFDYGPLQLSHGLVTYATVTAVSTSMPETEGCAKRSLTPRGWRSHDGLVRKTT